MSRKKGNLIFTISIKNWTEHQAKLKAGHTHILLSKRFFDDPKIAKLRQNECLLYINCLLIAGDMMSNCFPIHALLMPNMLRIDDQTMSNCLKTLQSFQLLTVEKIESFNTLREKKVKESKRKESNNGSGENSENSESEKPNQNLPAIHLSKAQIHGPIDQFIENQICASLLSKTKKSVQEAWLLAYPNAGWIMHEMNKANVWISANPKKAPKDFGRFFSNWLSRAFEQYRKGIPSNQQSKGEKLEADYDRVRREMLNDEQK